MFLAGCAHEFETLPDGLVAWYPMDDDPSSGVLLDASTNRVNGGCDPGKCPARVAGQVGSSALEFDDNMQQHFAVPDNGQLQQTDGFTVTVWIAPLGSMSTTPHTALAKVLGAGGDSWELVVKESPGGAFQARFFHTEGGTEASNDSDPEALPGSPDRERPTWSHLALSWNGRTKSKQLVINGASIEKTLANISFDQSALQIGGHFENGVSTKHVHAQMDDLRVYDHELSEDEIKLIMTLR